MKQAASEKDLLDIENDIERIQTAIKNKLGVSNPFLADIAYHIITPHNTREKISLALELLKSKKLNNPQKKHGNIPL